MQINKINLSVTDIYRKGAKTSKEQMEGTDGGGWT